MKIFRNPELLTHMNALSLRILEGGDVDADVAWHASEVCSSFSRLYLVSGGEGWVSVNGQRIALTAGHVYLIPAGLRYSYGTDSHLEKLFFHFNLMRPDRYDYFNRFGEVVELPISEEALRELRTLFYGEEVFAGALTVKLYILRLLSEIIEKTSYRPAYAAAFSARVSAAMQYIEERLCATLTVREVAGALFVSEGTLTQDFKEAVGCTVSRYIDDQVMHAAEEQILCTERTVSEISESLGFCDAFYFSRRFHAAFGTPPSLYREIYKKRRA